MAKDATTHGDCFLTFLIPVVGVVENEDNSDHEVLFGCSENTAELKWSPSIPLHWAYVWCKQGPSESEAETWLEWWTDFTALYIYMTIITFCSRFHTLLFKHNCIDKTSYCHSYQKTFNGSLHNTFTEFNCNPNVADGFLYRTIWKATLWK